MRYNRNGSLETYTDPRGNETGYLYNVFGSVTSVEYSDFSRTFNYYDGLNQLIGHKDEENEVGEKGTEDS